MELESGEFHLENRSTSLGSRPWFKFDNWSILTTGRIEIVGGGLGILLESSTSNHLQIFWMGRLLCPFSKALWSSAAPIKVKIQIKCACLLITEFLTLDNLRKRGLAQGQSWCVELMMNRPSTFSYDATEYLIFGSFARRLWRCGLLSSIKKISFRIGKCKMSNSLSWKRSNFFNAMS